MIFGPLSYHESQIGAVAVLKSHQFKCQFLGIGSKPIGSCNPEPPLQGFRDFRPLHDEGDLQESFDQPSGHFSKEIGISPNDHYLHLSTFPYARFRKTKGGTKAHVSYHIEVQMRFFYAATTASKHGFYDNGSNSLHPKRLLNTRQGL